MADALRNALERKLAAYEGAGMTEHATKVKARLAELDDESEGGLEELTKVELLEIAAEREIEGRHTMNKAELVDALEEG